MSATWDRWNEDYRTVIAMGVQRPHKRKNRDQIETQFVHEIETLILPFSCSFIFAIVGFHWITP